MVERCVRDAEVVGSNPVDAVFIGIFGSFLFPESTFKSPLIPLEIPVWGNFGGIFLFFYEITTKKKQEGNLLSGLLPASQRKELKTIMANT